MTSFADAEYYYDATVTDLKLYDIGAPSSLNLGNFYGDEFFFWKNEGQKAFYIADTADDCAITKVPYDLGDLLVDAAYYYDSKIYLAYRTSGSGDNICVIDKEGNCLDDFRLQDFVCDSGIWGLRVSKDKRIYIRGNFGIMQYDLKGNLKWEAPCGEVMSLEVGDDGKLFYERITDEEKINDYQSNIVMGFFEADTKKALPGTDDISGDIAGTDFCACEGDTVLYYDEYGIYKLDLMGGTKERLFDINAASEGGDLWCLNFDGKRIRFILYDTFGVQKLSKFYTLTPKTVTEIKLYDNGALSEIPSLQQIIDEYNKTVTEYNVVLTKKNTSANRPDIMFMDDALFKKNKGRLIDLETYMATSKGLRVSDFNAGILPACKDGTSVKMLPFNITLETFAVGEHDYFGKETFSFDDFLLYIEKDGVLYTDYFLSKESVMEAFMKADVTHFVDFDKATCSFDSEEFKELVEKVDGAYSDNRYTKKLGQALKDETGRMLTKTKINSKDWFKDKSMELGDDVILLGLPTADGQKKFHATAAGFGITEYCECKDVAIDFLEYLYKNYRPDVRSGVIPAYVKAFEKFAGYSDSAKIATAAGNIVTPGNKEARVVKLVTYWTDKYFNGEISLNYCVKSLQRAVTKYISK